ncbi:hypothetical protein ACRS3X_07885 [Ectopseudomonas hydrolytica]|uniref:hypothetical protein n=1 Tax=Ectopseudomonas hydrolytica TaxID=2493633 RepID=UPI003EE3C893
MELFKILDAVIDNAGDMLKQRAAVEEALTEDAIEAYAENAMDITLTASQAQQISRVGLNWVKQVNEGNGEWSRMRHEAQEALDG